MILGGMILGDTKDEWITDERHNPSEGSMAQLYPDRDHGIMPAPQAAPCDTQTPRKDHPPTGAPSREAIGCAVKLNGWSRRPSVNTWSIGTGALPSSTP